LIIGATLPGGKTAGLATLRGKPVETGCVDCCRNVARRKTAGLATLRESRVNAAALIIIATLIIGATSPGGKTAGLATLRGSRVNAATLSIYRNVDYWRNVARR